ncbi:serine hydrolase domain-containing protein [Bernardetia sp. ABR2-2B]|uniref:serine hydrolase domain-containing protein n=1 Tax=Bernardetia sp. ABR2-2B TaxID=3127472 RepID=UPI0030D30A55
MQTYLKTLLLITLSLLILSCSKEVLPQINTAEELDASLQKSYEKSNFGGFSVAVIKNGEVAFQKSYGKANIEKNIDLTNEMSMNIASISKVFIGVSLVKAIEDGYFTLETPINSILPFEVNNPNSTQPILIKHLITHTSGIKDDEAVYFQNYSILEGETTSTKGAQRMINELGIQANGNMLSLEDFMKSYLSTAGNLYNSSNFVNAPTGTEYSYSNIGSALAAYLIEIVTKTPFDIYSKQVIFEPLQMSHTAWRKSELNAELVSTQFFDAETPLPAYTMATYPDGALLTSIEDMTVFMQEMIKAKIGQSSLLLSKESYQLLFDKKLEIRPNGIPDKEDNYGVFWLWSKNGRIGHTGGDIGTTAFFGFDATTQSGSIVLINSNVEESGELSLEVLSEIVNAYKSFEAAN